MLSVVDARARARRFVEKSQRGWAAGIVAALADGPEDAVFELPLHPPTERVALADLNSAIAWVDQWRHVDGVAWSTRRWPSAGEQRVPERLILRGADAIAAFGSAVTARGWKSMAERSRVVRDRLGGDPESLPALAAVVRTHANTITGYSDAEFRELLDVVEWLLAHPASGRRVRELPIRGIHTKWLERHRKVTDDLYRALTGRDGLGLAESQSLIRVRFLDAALRPAGLTDLAMPAPQLARLDITPDVVFVFENLETVLAMPELPGAVVAHGGGYAVGRFGSIPWIRGSRVVYWGDLDSDGFRILNDLRVAAPDAASLLMGAEHVERYRDLGVVEPRAAAGRFDLLTDDEQAALALLRESGGLRIEQERIPWGDALSAIREQVG